MKEKIDQFLDYFSNITKDQADFIEEILKWDDETKIAYTIAKKLFEDYIEEDDDNQKNMYKYI